MDDLGGSDQIIFYIYPQIRVANFKITFLSINMSGKSTRMKRVKMIKAFVIL